MRDPSVVEEELQSIAAMADEATKFDAIVAWCATHPDEVPIALHMLLARPRRRREKSDAAQADSAELHS